MTFELMKELITAALYLSVAFGLNTRMCYACLATISGAALAFTWAVNG